MHAALTPSPHAHSPRSCSCLPPLTALCSPSHSTPSLYAPTHPPSDTQLVSTVQPCAHPHTPSDTHLDMLQPSLTLMLDAGTPPASRGHDTCYSPEPSTHPHGLLLHHVLVLVIHQLPGGHDTCYSPALTLMDSHFIMCWFW